MTQAVSQTFGFEWSQFLTQPWELNLLMTAVYSTFMCSNTRLAKSQFEDSWLVNLYQDIKSFYLDVNIE